MNTDKILCNNQFDKLTDSISVYYKMYKEVEKNLADLIVLIQDITKKPYICFDDDTYYPYFSNTTLSETETEKIYAIKVEKAENTEDYAILLYTDEDLSLMNQEYKWFNYFDYGNIDFEECKWALKGYYSKYFNESK